MIMTMNHLRTIVVSAVAVCALGATLLAHSVTGTVVSAKPDSIVVSVVDETTKKPASMTFDLNKDTKIMRGTKTVTFAEAKIQKGEKISVTIDHDVDEHLATIIKLDAPK
jgi:maltose-binding protein MalE